MHTARLLFLCGLLAGCNSSDYGDQPSDPVIPPPAGKGNRIHEVAEPGGKKEGKVGDDVDVTGAVVIAVDTFDETSNGKSKGTIYVADLGSKLPYSGISLYQPSFVPGDLQVGAGDTLDLKGTYQKNNTIPLQFAPNTFLVQIATPVATFRFDANVPDPVVIEDINELSDYDKGRKWLNMLVRLNNVVLADDAFPSKGRLSVTLPGQSNPARKCEDPFPKQPALVNELTDLTPIQNQLVKGATVKSIVGVVTFFCNLHIAPRTLADVQF